MSLKNSTNINRPVVRRQLGGYQWSMVGGICWKVCFEPGMKDWRCDGSWINEATWFKQSRTGHTHVYCLSAPNLSINALSSSSSAAAPAQRMISSWWWCCPFISRSWERLGVGGSRTCCISWQAVPHQLQIEYRLTFWISLSCPHANDDRTYIWVSE